MGTMALLRWSGDFESAGLISGLLCLLSQQCLLDSGPQQLVLEPTFRIGRQHPSASLEGINNPPFRWLRSRLILSQPGIWRQCGRARTFTAAFPGTSKSLAPHRIWETHLAIFPSQLTFSRAHAREKSERKVHKRRALKRKLGHD